ncbi:MAG: tetratricopeptide repeat protein [Xanthomonadales bacterium]|nr:tetratricopeptide repeat protein [Xanthomonadales bacterium]
MASTLVLAACTSTSELRGEDAPSSAQVSTVETDPDVMYHVFSGEALGADGLTGEAAYQYLEAAMESDDPAIAARATRIALAAQEWQLAAMAADRWTVLQPQNIDARQMAARTMIVVGDYTGAEHQLSELIANMSGDPTRAWTIVADLLSTSANPEKAGQVLENLVSDHDAGDSADALFARSIVAGRQGELSQALEWADRALEADAGRANIHAWAGRLAVNLELPDKALEHYRLAASLRPADRRIVMAYAELLRRGDRADEAQEALASLEDTPETRFARIAFALDSERDELALALYREFEDADYKDLSEAAFQAAQAAELLDRPGEAVEWYAQVQQGERVLVSSLRRAYLTADQGEVAQARALLEELRARGEEYRAESLIAESEILVEAGQPEQAMALLQREVRQHQPDTRVLYSRAMLGVQLDQLEQAEQDLRRIIENEPDNATALNALGYTLADQTDRYEEAEKLIRAAYALQPEESSIIDSMGWVAFRLGRLDEAERFLSDAWARDRNAEIGAHLGEVLWVAGRQQEARAVWREAVEVDPDNPVLIETMARFGVEF